ncbi:hypothetical protein ILYODFUR_034089 [Ilyodon furcidens]|uniref:Uncharacterized protein n=1 Tax=Ilyodon furcidens TaxID=33524 RepID=A0ABV0UBG8_9TELE
MLMLPLTGVLSKDLFLSFTVRAGDDFTWTCENAIRGHRNCDTTIWLYPDSGQVAVKLFKLGRMKKLRSNQLNVTSNCSLVVRNVRAEDVGWDICRQCESGVQSCPGTVIKLSVVYCQETTGGTGSTVVVDDLPKPTGTNFITDWRILIVLVVSVGSAGLFAVFVLIILLRLTQEKKPQMDKNPASPSDGVDEYIYENVQPSFCPAHLSIQ